MSWSCGTCRGHPFLSPPFSPADWKHTISFFKFTKLSKTWESLRSWSGGSPDVLTHPGLVKCVVLQAEQPAALATLQGRGRGRWQQVGRLGDHGRVGGGGEGSGQGEALQLPLSLLLKHLAHHHLLLLEGGRRRLIRGAFKELGKVGIIYVVLQWVPNLHPKTLLCKSNKKINVWFAVAV